VEITQITSRKLSDAMTAEGVKWSGSPEEPEFLSRLYDLQSLPTTDARFTDAAGDIWQHRVNNWDWEDHWVFYDLHVRGFRHCLTAMECGSADIAGASICENNTCGCVVVSRNR